MATGFLDVIDSYFTCEFTTIGRSGSSQTWPVTPRLLTDGRFFMATSIGLPQKAFNSGQPEGEPVVLRPHRQRRRATALSAPTR
jgi:hypothetical protein